ncbi:MAG TPA: YfiR family protein [Patescibacteria group bacterium]|nr:YfiR family protein [Patescibacteria group bacterium]
MLQFNDDAPATRRRRPRCGRWATRAIVLALIAALTPIATRAPAADSILPSDLEYQIKASFVYTVAKFVEWPVGSFASASAPLTLGIVGGGDVSDEIAAALRGKRVHDRELIVRRLADPAGACDCQILYVIGTAGESPQAVFDRTSSAGVLTVGETRDFAARGGILELAMQESMVQFEVNIAAAQKAGLIISSKILRLGHVIKGTPPSEEGRP